MSLYSSETVSNASKGKYIAEPDMSSDSEVKSMSKLWDSYDSWHYVFVHHARVNEFENKLKSVGHFNVFVHKSIVYRRDNKKLEKDERPTINGLVFIQGEAGMIQDFLSDYYPGIRLIHDCTTKSVAIIPDSQMQLFMKIARVGQSHSLRLLEHSFEYYSTGHFLVRVTSGLLSGLQGYIVRISREKSLVIALGNMTVAIRGITKECFENIDEYLSVCNGTK